MDRYITENRGSGKMDRVRRFFFSKIYKDRQVAVAKYVCAMLIIRCSLDAAMSREKCMGRRGKERTLAIY